MAKYEVRVRYAFEGTYMVAAGNREEAKRMVEEDCGLVFCGITDFPAMYKICGNHRYRDDAAHLALLPTQARVVSCTSA